MPPTFRRKPVVSWFEEHYPLVKDKSVEAHITAATVNSHSRHYYEGAEQDLIFKRSDGFLERYDPTRHGRWDNYGELISDSSLALEAENLDEPGEYTPRGPNTATPEANQRPRKSVGQSLLHEFEHDLSVDAIQRCLANYAAVTGYDAALIRLYQVTQGAAPDLMINAHRIAVLDWLRGWGCRHLRKTDTSRTSQVLLEWWEMWNQYVPGHGVQLTDMTNQQLSNAGEAYEGLRVAPAAGRSLRSGHVDVLFSDTAAAKTMFVVRPEAFLPWDKPIRLAFGWTGGGAAYQDFLVRVSAAILGLASRMQTPPEQLPTLLNRPNSTPAKIIDEYLWVKITRSL